jgi:hypothetical protein
MNAYHKCKKQHERLITKINLEYDETKIKDLRKEFRELMVRTKNYRCMITRTLDLIHVLKENLKHYGEYKYTYNIAIPDKRLMEPEEMERIDAEY